MLYGDHKPFFDSPEAYQDLGIDFDMSTWKGVLDYYGTPWMIWANASAKEVFSSDFRGTGPDVSPGYLMNVLFQELGWGGNAFMQFTTSILPRLPVMCLRPCAPAIRSPIIFPPVVATPTPSC